MAEIGDFVFDDSDVQLNTESFQFNPNIDPKEDIRVCVQQLMRNQKDLKNFHDSLFQLPCCLI